MFPLEADYAGDPGHSLRHFPAWVDPDMLGGRDVIVLSVTFGRAVSVGQPP
jgi:hypothetical protein